MKPPISYYGGKARLANWVIDHMPPHRVYVEPFAGSLAVLLAKTPTHFEVVNDLDDTLVCFWRVLRDHPDELVRACALTPHARSEFKAALDDPDLPDVERARRFWVRIMQSFNRTPDIATGWSMSTARGAPEVRTQIGGLGRFAAVAGRLRDVSIECAPAIEVIKRTSWTEDAVLYCDPPYVEATRSTSRARGGYRYEMTDEDHRELAEVLQDHPGTVIVSGYPSDLYDDLYADWWSVSTEITKRATNLHANATRSRATEVLWTNRDLSRQQQLEVTA